MTKKEYILKILETLKDDWDLAKWLAIITINTWENSKILDLIFNILKESLKLVNNEKFKNKIQNSIKELKSQLEIENKEIAEELLEFEKELENI